MRTKQQHEIVGVDDFAQSPESGGGGIRTREEPKRPLAIFETTKVAICRDIISSSPVNSPAPASSRAAHGRRVEQPVATELASFCAFGPQGICHRLPLVATARL